MAKARKKRFQWVWHGWRSWGFYAARIPRESWLRMVYLWAVRVGPIELRRNASRPVRVVADEIIRAEDATR